MRNITDLTKELNAKKKEAETLLKATMDKAETENRIMTDEEKASIEKVLGEARALRAQIDRKAGDQAIADEIDKLTAGLPSRTTSPANSNTFQRPILRSMGQQWVESDAFEFFRKNGHRSAGGAWRSPAVELFDPRMHAATLTTDAASGGDLIVSDVRPGIQPLLYTDVRVADLMASGTTESNSISYMKETTFTNAAATVAEAAAKPESTLIFDLVSDLARKIAHWLPVTEEMLEDVSQIRSYIDARLRLGVQLEEDDQLLQGSGVAPDFLGVRNRTGIATAIARGAGETNADAIARQIAAISVDALVMPDGIVMNPTNWWTIELSKDDSGNYLANGPFGARLTPMLWGLRVSRTPALAAGTSTVGAWASASQFFRKGGIRVEASNSHQDYFIKNLVAIRAEERGILAVYRPAAFGDVTGLN